MIYYIKGTLEYKTVDKIVVDANGIGYEILIPLSTYQKLPSIGEIIKIFIYYHSREDGVTLFGFNSVSERELFLILLTVTSIGPRSAINILSKISPKDLRSAILTNNIPQLTAISGIGKKTAERIVLELKDKIVMEIGENQIDNISGILNQTIASDEAISALLSLGYKQQEAKIAVLHAQKLIGDKAKAEEYIKSALKYLSK